MDPFGRPREDDLGRAIEYTVHHNRATVRVDAEDGGPTEVTFRRPGGDHMVVVPSGQVAQVAWQELNQRHARGEQLRTNRAVLPAPLTLDRLVALRRAHLAERHTLLGWSLADDHFNQLLYTERQTFGWAFADLRPGEDRQIFGLPLEVRRTGDLDGVSWLEWSVV
jgi:hypothetical protein